MAGIGYIVLGIVLMAVWTVLFLAVLWLLNRWGKRF